MRVLGVDPGGERLGLAVGDQETGVVVPLEVIHYGGVSPACDRIQQEVRRQRAGLVVIGLPTDADGNRTPACRRTERLAQELRDRGLHVSVQSEYLTTVEARRRAREAGLDHRRPVDHLAAQIMLEEFLEERG